MALLAATTAQPQTHARHCEPKAKQSTPSRLDLDCFVGCASSQ